MTNKTLAKYEEIVLKKQNHLKNFILGIKKEESFIKNRLFKDAEAKEVWNLLQVMNNKFKQLVYEGEISTKETNVIPFFLTRVFNIPSNKYLDIDVSERNDGNEFICIGKRGFCQKKTYNKKRTKYDYKPSSLFSNKLFTDKLIAMLPEGREREDIIQVINFLKIVANAEGMNEPLLILEDYKVFEKTDTPFLHFQSTSLKYLDNIAEFNQDSKLIKRNLKRIAAKDDSIFLSFNHVKQDKHTNSLGDCEIVFDHKLGDNSTRGTIHAFLQFLPLIKEVALWQIYRLDTMIEKTKADKQKFIDVVHPYLMVGEL